MPRRHAGSTRTWTGPGAESDRAHTGPVAPTVPTPTTRRRRSELLGVAADLIARTGYTRTSLRDVADAAGILAGSLYHHFDSKETIAVELVRAFHDDLDRLARDPGPVAADPVAALREFAQQMAQVVERHRAAVQLCEYDAPASATESLGALVRQEPPGLDHRWAALVRTARPDLRPEVDTRLLRALLRRSVLEIRSVPGGPGPREVVDTLASVLLSGVAAAAPPAEVLDASAAARAARKVIEQWSAAAAVGPSDRRGQILMAAREEFALRGFEATTVRDIAEDAGIQSSNLYRHFPSKKALLDEIMDLFSSRLSAGFEAVTRAGDPAVPTLDALVLLMSSAGTLFRTDFAVVKDWWRNLDATAPDIALRRNAARLGLVQVVVEDGMRNGDIVASRHPDLLSFVLRGVMWVTLDIPDLAAARRHEFLRLCILRGAALRPPGQAEP